MRRFLLRLLTVFRSTRADAELTREINSHLQLLEDQFVARGLPLDQARLAARRAFAGQVEQVKERQRDERSFRWMDESWLDLKLGARMLVKFPGITLIAVIALSVAIGGGAAYLEFVNEAIRPALPVPDGDRIVGVQQWNVVTGSPEHRSLRDFVAWREQLTSIELLGAYRPLERNLIGDDGRVEVVHGVEISASAFRLIPVPPLLGRPLVADDELSGSPAVVLLGHAVWQSRFGGDPAVVGKVVRLGNGAHTVVGVMPQSFGFPINHSLWAPLRVNAADVAQGEASPIRMFGRLARGATPEIAEAELTSIAPVAADTSPASQRRLRPQVKPFVQSLWSALDNGQLQMRVLYAVNLFFVGLLMLCGANVATLVFGRTVTREAEITVRTALGASRRRIIAQLFAEALVLTTIAAAVGLAAASSGLSWGRAKWLAGGGGGAAPFWWDDRLSAETVLYAAALAVVAAAIVGIVPALKATGSQMQSRLRYAAAGGGGLKFGGMWTGVIVGQVAVTVVFILSVVSIGWDFFASEYRGGEVAFARERYLSARLEPESGDVERRVRFESTYRDLERRLLADPAVEAVTYGTAFPGMKHGEFFVEFRDTPARLPADGPLWVQTASVADNFFDAFGASIISGRAFNTSDVELNRPIAIVDQAFVQQVLDGRNPIGQWVREPQNSENEKSGSWYEIVGVVADLSVAPAKTSEDAVIYLPAGPSAVSRSHVVVQLNTDARSFAPRLRTIAAEVDPTLRLYDVMGLDQVNEADQVASGFFLRAFAVVSAVALLLSTGGVYSMMAFTVARRTREIGIRTAIGADRWQILTWLFSRAFRQVGFGVALGSVPGGLLVMAGAPEVARGSGVSVAVLALGAIAVFMLMVTLLACAVPARRALGVHPTDALRAD